MSRVDLLTSSACNYYDGVTQGEAEHFYDELDKVSDPKISLGLNSQLVKDPESGQIRERVYKIGGLYSQQLEQVVYWLERALEVANPTQSEIIKLLVDYYRTGDLATFDDSSIAWVEDHSSHIDFVNGFIEVWHPLGARPQEGLASFRYGGDQRTADCAECTVVRRSLTDDQPIERKGVSAR